MRSRSNVSSRRLRGSLIGAVAAVMISSAVAVGAAALSDPRIGLAPGYLPWTDASLNAELVDNDVRVAPFDAAPNNFGFVNSDLTFANGHAFVGNFNGFQIYSLADPANPALRGSFVCPGGQGDLSVYGNLLFMSVEETRGRIDCGTQGAPGAVNLERMRGVRIFDISNLDVPVLVANVQTCRGSHTHTLVTAADDPDHVYVYNSGTSGVRSPLELVDCENAALTTDPVTTGNPTQWRIDIIKVPLANPAAAAIVNQPRIFTDAVTGAFNGLQNILPGTTNHPSGTLYAPTPNTNTCHDITAFPEIGLAAGACQGNGILLDISDPANPVRLDAVADPNFSYWHSATFNNDGTKVIFTDEWGGGTSARCRDTDRPEWGADAIFDIVDGRLAFASYYKLPVPQTTRENCVAHNGSIIPVPGRDILVQAWYQGGMSVVDFTDSAHPREIAFYDRGPIDTPSAGLNLGGFWSTYWFNGLIYASEIARGFDTLGLVANPGLTQNEIDAAAQIQLDQFNAQLQSRLVHDPSFAVVRAYYDQAVRAGTLVGRDARRVEREINRAEEKVAEENFDSAASKLRNAADRADGSPALADALEALADVFDAHDDEDDDD